VVVMNTLDAPSSPWSRVLGITVFTGIGYVVGATLANLLQAVSARTFHFRGSLSQLTALANPPWWSIAATLLGLWIGLVAAAITIIRMGWAPPLSEQFRLKISDLRFVGLGVGAQLLIVLSYAPFHLGTKINAPAHHLFGGAGRFIWLIGIMSVVGAPICEEILFRGAIYRGVYASLRTGDERIASALALVISAGLFALAHFELLQLPGLFFVGLLLSYVVKKTGRLAPAIVTHASFNAVAFWVVIFVQHGKI
jgi:uncharacterized protein